MDNRLERRSQSGVTVSGDALRYPLRTAEGRVAVLSSAGAFLAVAVGVRYAGAVAPSVVALLPASLAVVGLVVLFGTVACVLVTDVEGADAAPTPWRVVRAGARTLVLSSGVLAVPTGLLVATVAGLPGPAALEAGAGPVLLVSSTASLCFFLACAYALPAIVAASAAAGSYRAAVDATDLRTVLGDARYFLRWAVGGSCVGAAGWIASLTLRSASAPGLLAALVAASLLVVGARVVGEGYAAAIRGTPSA